MYLRRVFHSGPEKGEHRASEMAQPSARPGPGGQSHLAEKVFKVPKLVIAGHQVVLEVEADDEFLERARNELRETPEVVEQALKDIRLLVQGEPELIVPDEDEYFQKFLRPCKWYPKSAFELMKRFYRFRVNYPRVCNDLLPSNERAALSSRSLIPLPLRAADGCRVLLIEGGKYWRPKEVSLEQLLKGVMLSLDAAMAEPNTQIAGVRVLLDMNGLSVGQVTYFTPSFASMTVEWVQKCLPCRLKAIHIVNQPYIFNMIFAIFRPFLQEKLRKRIHFHGNDHAALLKALGTKATPTRYGGDLELTREDGGEKLWEYFCAFEEDFKASNECGFIVKK